MFFRKIIFCVTVFFWGIKTVWSCHQGGPMGFATNDPGGFSLDITLSPTYTGASTLGSMGCKNWDYTQHQKNLFLLTQWTYIIEEASKGEGENLIALAKIMGCTEGQQTLFAILLQENYYSLFTSSHTQNDFINNLETLLSQNESLSCTG